MTDQHSADLAHAHVLLAEGAAAHDYACETGAAQAHWHRLDDGVRETFRSRYGAQHLAGAVDEAVLLEEGTAAQLHARDHQGRCAPWVGLRDAVKEAYRAQARAYLLGASIVYRAYAAALRIVALTAPVAAPAPAPASDDAEARLKARIAASMDCAGIRPLEPAAPQAPAAVAKPKRATGKKAPAQPEPKAASGAAKQSRRKAARV